MFFQDHTRSWMCSIGGTSVITRTKKGATRIRSVPLNTPIIANHDFRYRDNRRWCTPPTGSPLSRFTAEFISRFYAVQALLRSVAPIITAEEELGGKAISEGWADIDENKLAKRLKASQDSLQSMVKKLWDNTYDEEYARLFRRVRTFHSWLSLYAPLTPHQRLGLRRSVKSDATDIFKRFLDLLEEHSLDFHSMFRKLSAFRPDHIQGNDEKLTAFISHLLASTPQPEKLDKGKASAGLEEWLTKYSKRITEERKEWGSGSQEEVDTLRRKEMDGVNPRFVLRQWVLEEVIAKVERDAVSGRRVLGKVLEVSFCIYVIAVRFG